MEPEQEQWKAREVARLLALVETERRYYQEIVATLPVGLLIVDPDLEVVSSNREIRRLFGLRATEPVSGRLDAYLPHSVSEQARDVIETGHPVANLMFPVPGEAERQLRVHIRRIRNWDENPRHEALLTVEDVVPRVAGNAAEPDVTAPPATELLDSLDAVVWAVELPSHRFLYVNEKGEELLGYPTAKWLESEDFWKERIHPDDRAAVLASYDRATDKWSRHVFEYRSLAAYGRTVWLRETVRPLYDSEGQVRHLIGFAVDVTERRLLENLRVQAERIEAVSRFANQLSYQIANQATIIGGYADEMLARLSAISGLRGDLTEISQAAGRLRMLSNELGSYLRTDTSTPAAVDLNGLLQEMQRELSAALGLEGRCDLHEFPGMLGAWANEEQLRAALLSLAREAASQGIKALKFDCWPVEIDECVTPGGMGVDAGVYAVITIQAESALPSIESHAPRELAVIYRQVRAWGGAVLTAGGVYQLYLRRAGDRLERPEPPQVPEEEKSLASSAAKAPLKELVLVVEGDQAIRSLISKMLQRQGYVVEEAADVQAAQRICDEPRGEVVVLIADLELTGLDWPSFAAKLQQKSPKLKAVYFSTDASPAALRDWVTRSGAVILNKPFTLGTLLQQVKELRGSRAAVA